MKTCGARVSWVLAGALASTVSALAWDISVADSGSLMPRQSLAVVNGKPAFSYRVRSGDVKTLMYVRAATADGSAWDDPMIVEELPHDHHVQGGNLEVVGGLPAFCYFHWDTRELKLAYNGPWPVQLVSFTVE
jgi:hypothetical protein